MTIKKFNTIYESSWSSSDHLYALDTGGWRTVRPVVDAAKCRQCGWCYLYCPVSCVVEKDNCFAVNYDYCKGCGICAKECPSMAISMVAEEVD